ncbi:hypothetical protein OSCI_2970004 [Kamptonema sp. PCC 6506]|uniref:hypothetical protein n=1 Tax=Kamptonema formosum TaxID=331992 RepID=UPI0001DACAEF|nr:hypothetical protein [Kamptonema formosum]CBN56289.1 hypothetical protein OSCI_2970004 [Kamptonema sp. PCC 6506]
MIAKQQDSSGSQTQRMGGVWGCLNIEECDRLKRLLLWLIEEKSGKMMVTVKFKRSAVCHIF